jgi:hypothetical protein
LLWRFSVEQVQSQLPVATMRLRLLVSNFLRDAAKADERFNTEMRKAAQQVAENLNEKAKAEAATVTRSRQATEVMKGMRARRDRIPTIKLSETSAFVSKSNPNRKRKRKVTRGDVFFGAEFGGQARLLPRSVNKNSAVS